VFAALSPARRRFFSVLLALVLAAAVVAGLAVLRSARADGVQPVAQNRPGPILLVPGYGGSVKSLAVLDQALRAKGRDVAIVGLPDAGTGDLRQQAQTLATAAKAAIARTHAPSVDVIGYSAGGVVARLWVKDFGGGNLARRVVTLGSPQHGTGIAGVAVDLAPSQCPTACQQLAPDSDLLRALDAGDETPAGPEFVSIWTTDDQTVTPPDSASLAGAADFSIQSVCPGVQVAHGDLPTAAVMIAAVLLELQPTPVVTLTASDCSRISS
jgi:triacylglycerol lipase